MEEHLVHWTSPDLQSSPHGFSTCEGTTLAKASANLETLSKPALEPTSAGLPTHFSALGPPSAVAGLLCAGIRDPWVAGLPPSDLHMYPDWAPTLLDKVASELHSKPFDFRHHPLPEKILKNSRLVMVDDDPLEHLRQACLTAHPTTWTWVMEASADYAVRKLEALRHETIAWRKQMLDELDILKSNMEHELAAWRNSVPDFVNSAYKDSGFHVPLFIHLLKKLGYPDAAQLEKDLSGGFELAGDIPSGVGWPPSSKPGPSLSWEEFYSENDKFVTKRLSSHRARCDSGEYDFLLNELITERGLGRVTGPYEAPVKWGVAAGLPAGCGATLLPPPADDDCYPSFVFPIEQVGSDGFPKIRRGEDWKRSFSNRLARTKGKPVHHTIDHYTQGARVLTAMGFVDLLLWGHDHEGAYRQFPAFPRKLMWALLEGEGGSFSLWQHCVMLFGAKAAVWAYNRIGDAVIFLFRTLFFSLCFHYVDDYGGVEPAALAQSAFDSFTDFSKLLGFKLKPSKAQPPNAKQIMLGVEVLIENGSMITKILETRKQRMTTEIAEKLGLGRITPKQAQILAGKTIFTNSSTFGCLGAAALRPLYRRAAYGGTKIDTDIEASLHLLRTLLHSAPPRSTSLAPCCSSSPMLYADAFYVVHGVSRRVADFSANDNIDQSTTNGWGVMVIKDGLKWHFSGSVPSKVFTALKSKKTYIFLLEVVAQCFGAWLMAPELLPSCWAFVDNVGAEHALRKGFSRDRDANAVISLFWSVAAATGVRPWFERVPSNAQLADGVSRGSDELAVELGSRKLNFVYDDFWDIIVDMVEAGGLADSTFTKRMLKAISTQRKAVGLPLLDSDGTTGTLDSGSCSDGG